MSLPAFPAVLAAARAVAVDSTLTPCQVPTSRKLQRASHYHERWMLKHRACRSQFHSRTEYLHAGLLEGAPSVSAYVPQPFRVRIRGKPYIPDCYVRDGDQQRVIELRPEAKMADDMRIPLEQFFALHRMRFEVISNAAITAREQEAENWHSIVQVLCLGHDLDSTHAEWQVLGQIDEQDGRCTLGDIVDKGDRERCHLAELALFRLLHRGVLRAALTEHALDYTTEFQRCP